MKFKTNIEVIVEADSAWAAGDALRGIFLAHVLKSPTPSCLIDWAYGSGDFSIASSKSSWVETDDGGEYE
jgi:hypothetical protein